MGKELRAGGERTTATDPQIGDGQSFPKSRIDRVDQVPPVGGDEGAVVGRQTHGLGLLVTHAVGRVRPRHVARVGLVQRHQVELEGQSEHRDLSNNRGDFPQLPNLRPCLRLTRREAELILSDVSPLV